MRRAEVYPVSGSIDHWGYIGYEVKFIDGKNITLERFVCTLSDIGNSLLIMGLEQDKKNFYAEGVREVFHLDKESIERADTFIRMVALTKANKFCDNVKPISVDSMAQYLRSP